MPEVDVPEHRGFGLVGLSPGQVAQERALGDALAALVDGGVGHLPVHRKAQGAPELFECLLVLGGELVAQGHEVGPADVHGRVVGFGGGGVVGVVVQGRVTGHAVVVLDTPFGGQAVVVPTHRVEDLTALHPLVAGDGVGVGVGEHVAHVQGPADGGGRGVDGEHLVPGPGAVEAVGPLLVPAVPPPGFEPFQGGLGGYPPGPGSQGGGGGVGSGGHRWGHGTEPGRSQTKPIASGVDGAPFLDGGGLLETWVQVAGQQRRVAMLWAVDASLGGQLRRTGVAALCG